MPDLSGIYDLTLLNQVLAGKERRLYHDAEILSAVENTRAAQVEQ